MIAGAWGEGGAEGRMGNAQEGGGKRGGGGAPKTTQYASTIVLHTLPTHAPRRRSIHPYTHPFSHLDARPVPRMDDESAVSKQTRRPHGAPSAREMIAPRTPNRGSQENPRSLQGPQKRSPQQLPQRDRSPRSLPQIQRPSTRPVPHNPCIVELKAPAVSSETSSYCLRCPRCCKDEARHLSFSQCGSRLLACPSGIPLPTAIPGARPPKNQGVGGCGVSL